MATQQQILANRENAQASTGPQSFAGKLASSRNATRHGLTASSIDHFPSHVQEEYLAFREPLLSEFQPGSANEKLLFERYAFAQFLLLRAEALHVSAFEQTISQLNNHEAFNHLNRVQRYLRGLERSAVQALRLLEESYANRCAAVEVQDVITHTLNSPVVVPPAAPVARMLNSSAYRTSADNVALRLTFVEQARLSREQNEPNPGLPPRESSSR